MGAGWRNDEADGGSRPRPRLLFSSSQLQNLNPCRASRLLSTCGELTGQLLSTHYCHAAFFCEYQSLNAFMFERESGGARLSGVYRFSVFWGRLAASPRSSASMGRKKEGKKAGCQTSCSEESSPSSCPPAPSLFSPQCLAVFPETKHANTCSGF